MRGQVIGKVASGKSDVRLDAIHERIMALGQDQDEIVENIREMKRAVDKTLRIVQTLDAVSADAAKLDRPAIEEPAMNGVSSQARSNGTIQIEPVNVALNVAPAAEARLSRVLQMEESQSSRRSSLTQRRSSLHSELNSVPETIHESWRCSSISKWSIPYNANSSLPTSFQVQGLVSHHTSNGVDQARSCTVLSPSWPATIQLRKGMRGKCSVYEDVLMSSVASQDNFHEQKQGRICGPWNPHAQGVVVFDCLGLAMLLYDLSSTPVQLAWNVPIEGPLVVPSTISAIYWTICMAVAFRTGFYERGELKMDSKDIVWNYTTTFFWFDLLLATVDWVALLTLDSGSVISALRTYRVLRLFKVVRAFKIMALLDKLVPHWLGSDSMVLVIVKVGCFTLFFTHLMCCAWFSLGQAQVTDTGLHWVDGLNQDEPLYLYLASYHWVLVQVGLGSHDINPTNSYERAFCIVMNIFGLLYSSIIVSIVSAQAMEYVTVRRERVEDMSRLSTFLDQHKVELRLANRVRRQANDRLKTNETMLSEEHVRALSLLSADLLSDILNVVRLPHVVSHPLFQYWARVDAGATRRLCHEVVCFAVLTPDDCAFMPGILATEAYYVTPLRTSISAGSIFGKTSAADMMVYTQFADTSFVDEEETVTVKEGTWVAEAALWTEWTHVGKLTAQCACQLLTADPTKLHPIMAASDRIAAFTRMYAREFCLRLRAASPPFAPWPNDLRVPGTDPDSMLSQQASRGLLMREWNAGRLGMNPRLYEELLEEIKAEKSAVVSAADQGLQRVVFVSALRLTDFDGRMMVRIGKWTEAHGLVPASPELPAVKHDRSELPRKALQHLLLNELVDLEPGIEISSSTEESDFRQSTKYGMMTKYLRTVHDAQLRADFETPQLSVAGLLDTLKLPLLPIGLADLPEFCATQVYVIHTKEGQVDLYAWLSEDAVNRARSNQDIIKSWMLSLDPSSFQPRHKDELEVLTGIGVEVLTGHASV